MLRYARYQLSLEDQQAATNGIPLQLHTFKGDSPRVFARSLKHTNNAAFEDHLFELTVDGRVLILSASELTQVLQSV